MNAITRYLKSLLLIELWQGLSVTGKLDQQTADRLGSAKAPAPAAPSTADVKMEVFPVQGKCWFGDTWHAPRGGGRLHVGTDIIAASGNLLYAVVDGTISKQYWDQPGALHGHGLRIEQANGTYFTYLHMMSFAHRNSIIGKKLHNLC